MGTFESLGEGIWSGTFPLRVPGLAIGTRTTIVRQPDGGLLVHSPGPIDEALAGEVKALGSVRHVVAPNRFHHLYVRDWKDAFPEAQFHACPGLREKRKSFEWDHDLGDEPHADWRDVVDQHVVKGAPMMSEVVFFHAPSGTLVSSDLAMNITEASGFATRMFWTVNGAWKKFGPTRMVRFTFKDKPAVRASIARILDWDFDRVLIAHGESLQSGGKETLREVYSRV